MQQTIANLIAIKTNTNGQQQQQQKIPAGGMMDVSIIECIL